MAGIGTVVNVVNIFRRLWLAANLKAAIGGNMDSLKKILVWVANLHLIPSGYLTMGAGWIGILLALACMLGISIPGYTCPTDPAQAFIEGITGLGLIGLGRRKA